MIAVLIGKGVNRIATIYPYLADQGCPHNFTTVQFILDAYDGGDWRHCVWWRNKAGRYNLLGGQFD